MGCGSSKTTATEPVQQTATTETTTSQREEKQEEKGQQYEDNQPKKKAKIPRGNVAKYSAYLSRWQVGFHNQKHPQDLNSQPTNLDFRVFPLQEGTDPEDLTPWRDEDTRIVCPRVKENVTPYFWDFSDGAQRVADEIFQNSLRPFGPSAAFICGPVSDTERIYYSSDANYGEDRIPVNPESVAEYFQDQLRHPVARCYNCIQYDMTFQVGVQKQLVRTVICNICLVYLCI